jgi:hypothetical protein
MIWSSLSFCVGGGRRHGFWFLHGDFACWSLLLGGGGVPTYSYELSK